MMKVLRYAAVAAVLATGACARQPEPFTAKPGSQVSLETTRGVKVEGRLVEVRGDSLVVEAADGRTTEVRRSDVARVERPLRPRTDGATVAGADAERGGGPLAKSADTAPRESTRGEPSDRRDLPAYREVTLPAGTLLPAALATALASDTSRIEDPVRATLRRAVVVDGLEAIPAGAIVSGHVTAVERPGRVKGRGRIAFRFTTVTAPGDAERLRIRTAPVARLAPATKKEDAARIGGGAAGGAVIGGILGGGDGAVKGAAIGGAAGTGVVLSTRGRDVRLDPGTPLSIRLTEPLTVRVRQAR